MPQAHRRPHLILNLSEQPDLDTLSVNGTTKREATPELLQGVWEANAVQGLVRVSKLDVTDGYHCGTFKTAHVGAFTYVIPSAQGYEGIFIYIGQVLPMGWVDSPKFFCVFL